MVDAWLVRGKREVPWSLAPLYADARHRVLHSRRLAPYLDIILDDAWADDEDHLRWVIRGRVGEIEGWAKTIAKGVADD
jgi:hypothetical protein